MEARRHPNPTDRSDLHLSNNYISNLLAMDGNSCHSYHRRSLGMTPRPHPCPLIPPPARQFRHPLKMLLAIGTIPIETGLPTIVIVQIIIDHIIMHVAEAIGLKILDASCGFVQDTEQVIKTLAITATISLPNIG